MSEQLISEPIKPVPGTFDASRMARGEPGLPRRFHWRKREYTVARILDSWKDIKPGEDCPDCMYLKKHWYRVRCEDGTEMRLYFDRQPRRGRRADVRWFIYSVIREEPGDHVAVSVGTSVRGAGRDQQDG